MDTRGEVRFFKKKDQEFIRSILSDTPLSGEPPKLIQPPDIEISDLVTGTIDEKKVKQALKENKPPFNFWELTRTTFNYGLRDAVRNGKYTIAEIYRNDRKKSAIAWPITILLSALFVKSLINIEPPVDYSFSRTAPRKDDSLRYDDILVNKLEGPPILLRMGISTNLNENMYLLVFKNAIKDPLAGFYDPPPELVIRMEEPKSNRIKRLNRDESIRILKKGMDMPLADYKKISESLDYPF